MIINDEQKKRLVDNPVLKDITCPVCKNTELVLTDKIFELREFSGGNLRLRGKSSVIPVISILCEKCGHIILLNAVKLGLVTSDIERDQEEHTD
ncbi:MAG: hypothetical protein EHM12_07045 [Dehalococcoidia bacterium]|nr:MAG: hypothetical protein EHM12_07045 [Dehalococcoidia bacterium]